MTATLLFTLPEEQQELTAALQAQEVRGVLEELDTWLRGEMKYANPPEAQAEALQRARDKLWELMGEAGIRLWD